jgi:hypothetical protein
MRGERLRLACLVAFALGAPSCFRLLGPSGTGSDADADIDVDGDSSADGDGDADVGADGDADGDGDGDADGDPDALPDVDAGCPAYMVLVAASTVCIDRYEASRGVGDVAASVVGATACANVSWEEAGAMCAAAGKRLCDEDEWLAACGGPDGLAFPYGDAYDPDLCNGRDHGVGALVPTASMVGCEGGYPGLFDMSGNAGEWTSNCQDLQCVVRGGSYGHFESYLGCGTFIEYNRVASLDNLGFRCCLTP